MSKLQVSVVVFAIAVAAAQVAFATPIPAFNYDGTLDRARNDIFTIGDSFTVGSQSLTVSALGAQDFGPSGANTNGFEGGSVPVGIWSADGSTLLASASVLSSDPLDGTYRYHTLGSPLTLVAGTTYLIGAVVGSTTEYWGDSDDPNRGATPDSYSTSSLILPGSAKVAFNGSTLTAPTNDGGGASSRWAPANFEAAAVPEPASLGLLAFGGLGLLAFGGLGQLARRRRA